MSNKHQELEQTLKSIATTLALKGFELKHDGNRNPFGAGSHCDKILRENLPLKTWIEDGEDSPALFSIALPMEWFVPNTLDLSKRYICGFLDTESHYFTTDAIYDGEPHLVGAIHLEEEQNSVVIKDIVDFFGDATIPLSNLGWS